MSLTTDERALYEDVWTSIPHYADISPGEFYLPVFLQCVNQKRGTVLDAGAGSGKGALALAARDYRVTMCDVTDVGLSLEARELKFREACLWHSLKPIAPFTGAFDWVYCTDVMEHLPPQFTMLAIDQMLRVARLGLFLSVSLVPDNFGVWTGKSLHQTVQSFVWWRDSLNDVGQVEDARDLHHAACFYVRPR